MRNNAYTVSTVQAQVAQTADNCYPTDKWLSSYIRKIDVLSCGNLDKTPIKSLEFDAREFSSIGRSILLFASLEKEKNLYFVCRCLYSFYIVKH